MAGPRADGFPSGKSLKVLLCFSKVAATMGWQKTFFNM
jgi:hypothetical protein